ncbi:MAG: bifunctional nuclease family protein [Phycisphaerae bacterium]
MDVPVELSRILITELGEEQVIFLKEKDGQRSFPIMIGIAEALAIDRRIKGIQTPRPLTHQLLANVIEQMGGEVEKVVVSDLRDATFFATLYIRQNGRLVEVDARPSDAIALGVGMDVPFYVSEQVFRNVLNEPTTAEERLELLRRRRDYVGEKIRMLESFLSDEDLIGQADADEANEIRRKLEEFRAEYDAIERVLRKHG